MKMNISRLFSISMLIILIGCGGVPVTYYYQVNYDLPNSGSKDPTIPITLAVQQFDADILYEGERIVYRDSPYEVKFYHYRRWVAPPRKIVTQKVLEQLKASGLFQQVVMIPSPVNADFVLRGKIKAFEEWDEGDSWYGLVSLSFQLQNAASKEIVWENEYSKKTAAEHKDPVKVVEAISQSLKAVIERSIEDVEQSLKSL